MSDRTAMAASLIARRNGSGAGSGDTTRYSDQQVVFLHEFTLGGSEELYPPGTYTVETAEDVHERNGHSAFVRTSCMLIVRTASGSRAVQIRAGELEAALAKDVQRQQLSAPTENPDSGKADKGRPAA
ncbi:MAG TPA: hypothetical protein VIL42_03075 [Sphingomicrobium sp.]|jgi:hypothetical protein